MSLTVTILKGLPGCGKSTWAKQQIDERPTMYKRVSKDDLRAMLDNNHFNRSNEKFLLQTRDLLIMQALEAGKHVLVDDTNLHPKHEARIRQLVKDKAAVVIKDFTDVPVNVCIERDLKRFSSVGERVIRTMYNEFLRAKTPLMSQNPEAAPAIMCDLDGTLALLNGRNPYDASKAEDDVVNQPVAEIVKLYAEKGFQILFCSGREDQYREPTVRFLTNTFGDAFAYQLLMRKSGDQRKDSIVKREMFDANIRDKYNVSFVLDDRNQVVDMWREIGLTCLQVDYGDF